MGPLPPQFMLNWGGEGVQTGGPSADKQDLKSPQLLLTISGEGGSGKSTLVKTIVGTLRRMFQSNSCVKVAAPTGSAYFNGGGVTMHRLFNLPVNLNTYLLQNDKM